MQQKWGEVKIIVLFKNESIWLDLDYSKHDALTIEQVFDVKEFQSTVCFGFVFQI